MLHLKKIRSFEVIMQHPTSADIQRVREFLLDLQARICAALEQQEQRGGGSAQFMIDDWQRAEGGGGRSRVLQDGEVIEKGGVMFSHIDIRQLPLLRQNVIPISQVLKRKHWACHW
jgi:coproporphyrinogen III oxidase